MILTIVSAVLMSGALRLEGDSRFLLGAISLIWLALALQPKDQKTPQ